MTLRLPPVLHHVRRCCVLGLVCLGPIVLAACGSVSSERGSLRVPILGHRIDPGIFDPVRASDHTSLFLASLFNVGLVKFGPDLHVIPELAVSIPTITSSGRTYTFTIRQDARFADGRSCTAADVVYSLTRTLRHSAVARRYLSSITGAAAVIAGRTGLLSGVQAIDSLTVRIRLTAPDASFLSKLALPVAAIVERGSGSHPAGLGPWVLATRTRDKVLVLRPRHHFYGGPLAVREVRLIPVTSAARAVSLFRHGALDVSPIPIDLVGRLIGRSDFHQSDALVAYYALAPPSMSPQLAARLDRDHLVKDASPALMALANIVPPPIPDYVSSSPAPDPPAAGTRLERVSIRVPRPVDPLALALRHALSLQWPSARDGAPVEIIRESQIVPDPGRWLTVALPQTSSRWYRSILSRARDLTNDPVSRMSLYSDGEGWALQHALVIPLAVGTTSDLIRSSVNGLQVTPMGLMPDNNNWALVSVP